MRNPGVHTKFIPDYSSLIPSRPYTEDLMGLPVINIRYVPLTNTGNMVIKRAMDIVWFPFFGIIITSPIMLISAILVKLSSPGPVIFKQERVGLHNKPFYMYKFRSMAMQTAAEEKKRDGRYAMTPESPVSVRFSDVPVSMNFPAVQYLKTEI